MSEIVDLVATILAVDFDMYLIESRIISFYMEIVGLQSSSIHEPHELGLYPMAFILG